VARKNFKFKPDKFNKQQTNKFQQTGKKENFDKFITHSEEKPANAPYNFVPLNKSVVESDPIPLHDTYFSDRFTGYFDCEMETITPIYIGGSLKEDGKIRIPGSSLRGMVRNLLEIVSWSNFGFFEDKNLYYRSFADVSSLRDEYKERINPEGNKSAEPDYKMKAGYLVRKGFEYFIYPAKKFEKKSRPEAISLVSRSGHKYSEFNYYKLNDGSCIVVSGSMPRKKDWIISPIDKNPENIIQIPEKDIKSYKLDENRADKVRGKDVPNLINLLDKDQEIPCFFIRWTDKNGDERISFGHTGLFRIAYEKSIGEHIPSTHENNRMDFAHAIFGTSESEDKFLFLFN